MTENTDVLVNVNETTASHIYIVKETTGITNKYKHEVFEHICKHLI